MTQLIKMIPIIKDMTLQEMILFGLIALVFLFKNNGLKNIKKILRIKYIDTLYEQMSILESAHIDILFEMHKIFKKMESNKKNIKDYKTITVSIEREIKGIIRKWFKENHFSEKTEDEFLSYVNKKIKLILERVSFSLDDEYEGDRDKLKKLNEEYLVPYASTEYRKVFYDARNVSIKNEAKIKKLEKKLF